ncbi:hypothetical protein ACFSRY_00205 [Pontibacter locisalis]|uniref:Transmembrane protein n=1 Tax=Pontibacter locisalis TaxID=1719035 RepID=A0ABW5IGX7_9BACT
MRYTLLLMLLLCSCATQRQAEKYFDANPDKLADYVDKNEAYTQQYGGAYAVKHFPPKLYPPPVFLKEKIIPSRLLPTLMLERKQDAFPPRSLKRCPECKTNYITKTVYREDTAKLEALDQELKQERVAHDFVKKQLRETEAERDYWMDMNEKKFWALIAMAVFALLYILFKILANRVRVS